MLFETEHFTDAKSLREHYASVKKRINTTQKAEVKAPSVEAKGSVGQVMIAIEEKPPEPDFTEELLKAYRDGFGLKRVKTREIIEEVARQHNLRYDEIMTPTRQPRISHPRQEAMYRLREEKGFSYPKIAMIFGLDHTTVIYGVRAYIKRRKKQDGK